MRALRQRRWKAAAAVPVFVRFRFGALTGFGIVNTARSASGPSSGGAPLRAAIAAAFTSCRHGLTRALTDALTDAGVIVDDARFVDITARKVFPLEDVEALEAPGVRVEVRRLETREPQP